MSENATSSIPSTANVNQAQDYLSHYELSLLVRYLRFDFGRRGGADCHTFSRLISPLLSPSGDSFDYRTQGLALLGQVILDAHGHRGSHRADDDSFNLQLFQTLRHHTRTQAGDGLGQLTKPRHADKQGAQDGARPATSDQLHGAVIMGAERFQLICFHHLHYYLS